MSQQPAPRAAQAPVFVEEWRGWWEHDRQKLALQLRLEFASGGKLFGDGHDSHSQFQLGGSYTSNTAAFRTSLTEKRPSRLFQATIERGNVMKGFWEFEVAGAASKSPPVKAPFWLSRASGDGSTPRETAPEASGAASALSGSDRLRNYELLEPLGNGVFGLVSKVRRLSDNKILVWKELNYGRMNTNERRMMMNEVQILSNTSHAHIVKYFDTILVREKQKMCVMHAIPRTPYVTLCPGTLLSSTAKTATCRKSSTATCSRKSSYPKSSSGKFYGRSLAASWRATTGRNASCIEI